MPYCLLLLYCRWAWSWNRADDKLYNIEPDRSYEESAAPPPMQVCVPYEESAALLCMHVSLTKSQREESAAPPPMHACVSCDANDIVSCIQT